MVPRACKSVTRGVGRDIQLLNISAHAQHAMKLVPVCSACNEIRSAYAQHKFTCKTVHILPLAEHARKFVPRMLSVR